MSKISPCLWFATQAEDAANFYVRAFREAGQQGEVGKVMRYTESGYGPTGSVLTVEFTLADQEFVAVNGGTPAVPSHAISLSVACKDQAEVDRFWEALLSDGGKPQQCGWLTDKFGVPWQVVPTMLQEMLRDSDPARADRVMQAVLKMIKLDVAALKKAYDGA